ncbi:MAG: NAD-binding protein, partial [Bdellovibrionales bacterium]|nr:NAD-binding protein [Bdellovibrionales bacterium]
VGTVSASMTTYFSTRMDSKDLLISDLKGHVILCGWDRMGSVILQELESVPELWRNGVVVVAHIASDERIEDHVKNSRRLFHINDDFTKIEVLESANAQFAKTAIVLADKGENLRDQDRDARTVLAALTLEKLNPKIFTCAELLDDRNSEHLKIAGVEEIISRTNLTAGLFASTAINTGIASVVNDLLTHQHGNYMKKLPTPKEFVGKPYVEAMSYFKQRFDATIIAIERKIDSMPRIEQIVNPCADEEIRQDDQLVLIFKQNSKIIGV